MLSEKAAQRLCATNSCEKIIQNIFCSTLSLNNLKYIVTIIVLTVKCIEQQKVMKVSSDMAYFEVDLYTKTCVVFELKKNG